MTIGQITRCIFLTLSKRWRMNHTIAMFGGVGLAVGGLRGGEERDDPFAPAAGERQPLGAGRGLELGCGLTLGPLTGKNEAGLGVGEVAEFLRLAGQLQELPPRLANLRRER